MGDRLVRVEDTDGVRRVTLDSQHNRNALSRQLTAELLEAVQSAAVDESLRVVVLGADGPAFCSGADLREMTSDDADRAAGTRNMLATFRAIAASPCPVVAQVHGHVRAGGVGIVAACDVAIASTEATFALSEVRLALAPAIISLTVGPRMHDRAASQTWLTGETFDGERAAAAGLVTAACPPDELDQRVDEVVGAMARNPRQGLAATKSLLNAELVADIDARGEQLAALSASLFATDDAQAILRRVLDRG